MPENYLWRPSPAAFENSNIGRFMKRHGIAGYRELVARSTADIEWFWNAVVEDLGIEFYRPFDTLLDTSDGIPWSRWFVGGQVNLAHNCLDRHARSARRDHTAIIWEGEQGESRRLTYAELHAETCRLSNALKRLGVGRGDAVGLFLPLVPEAVIAFLACAKIGAIAVPIFSGFGAQAVAARLDDARAKVLDHRGHQFPARQGRLRWSRSPPRRPWPAPSVRHVIVARDRRESTRPAATDSGHLDWDESRRGRTRGVFVRIARPGNPADDRLHLGHHRACPRGPCTCTAGFWSRSRRKSPTRSTCTRTTVFAG